MMSIFRWCQSYLKNLEVEKIDLMENKLYLVGNKEFQSILISINDKSIIENIPIIYREKGSGTRQVMEQIFGKQTNCNW
jgi:LysR family transcriptional regulator, low CO2-responsive transcriptional regulator